MAISQLQIRELVQEMETKHSLSSRAVLLFELGIETYDFEVVSDLVVPIYVYEFVLFGEAFTKELRRIGRRENLLGRASQKEEDYQFTAQAFFHLVMDRYALERALTLPEGLIKNGILNEDEFQALNNRHLSFFGRLERD